MGGVTIALIIAIAALAALAAALMGTLIAQRVRLRRLAARLEDFLSGDGQPLAFSVREDGLAPLHNSIAELQNRLLLAREHEAEECRRTSDLTADISHQLKTPLASLRLFCEMDAGAHLDVQLGQIDRMEQLIFSLLRLERLCADGYDFTFAEHDVGEIVRETWASLVRLYPDRELRVEGGAEIRCDDKWLGEALLNLLKNACEHTRPGGRVLVRMETTQAAFFCTVEDDGGGVSGKDLAHLFERFYRAEGSEDSGAGLGLAIVREIVYRHHGSVHAENTASGLKICISIPVLNLAKS